MSRPTRPTREKVAELLAVSVALTRTQLMAGARNRDVADLEQALQELVDEGVVGSMRIAGKLHVYNLYYMRDAEEFLRRRFAGEALAMAVPA